MTFRLSTHLWACALFFLFLVQACGSQEDALLSETKAPLDERPLLVIMGGNTSCQTDQQNRANSPYANDLYLNAQQRLLKNRSLNSTEWRYIASCYTSSASVYYATSDAPNDIKISERPEFERMVKAAALRSKASFLTGHSYGGWLAMKVAHHMFENGMQPQQNVEVFTVDPISREHCSFGSPFGCQASPQDFSAAARQNINDVSTAWLNFYQTTTWYLHSEAMAEADDNTEIDASHTQIDNDAGMWARIEQTVLDGF